MHVSVTLIVELWIVTVLMQQWDTSAAVCMAILQYKVNKGFFFPNQINRAPCSFSELPKGSMCSFSKLPKGNMSVLHIHFPNYQIGSMSIYSIIQVDKCLSIIHRWHVSFTIMSHSFSKLPKGSMSIHSIIQVDKYWSIHRGHVSLTIMSTGNEKQNETKHWTAFHFQYTAKSGWQFCNKR
jgi:hypothetical protein